MASYLVDAAHARGALKRGGNVLKVNFDESMESAFVSGEPQRSFLALDDALTALRQLARDRRRSSNCAISAD